MRRARASALALAAALGIGLFAAPAAVAEDTAETRIGLIAKPAATAQPHEARPAADAPPCLQDSSGPGHQFGHYRGETVVPSASQSTAAGLEAQCILAMHSRSISSVPHPGPYDGIFGEQSQRSMEAYQKWQNEHFRAGLDEDGLPGPASWPYLRGTNPR